MVAYLITTLGARMDKENLEELDAFKREATQSFNVFKGNLVHCRGFLAVDCEAIKMDIITVPII